MVKLNPVEWVMLALVILGDLNWGFIGWFKWSFFDAIFGTLSVGTRLWYIAISLCALWLMVVAIKLRKVAPEPAKHSLYPTKQPV